MREALSEAYNYQMDKPRVYLETSVISYLAARPSADIHNLARQHSSLQLWQMTNVYELFVSDTVLDEAMRGDAAAAQLRIGFLKDLPRLADDDAATGLAKQLILLQALPPQSYLDALHIALAAVYGMNYIASWNFKHIVGATARNRITQTLRQLGYTQVTIHTPEELVEATHDE